MFIKELDYTIDLSKIVYIKRSESDALLPSTIYKPYIMIIFNYNIEIKLYYDNEKILNERYNYISDILTY